MKSKIGRKSLALIAVTCGMTGCTKSDAPATPPVEPSSATSDVITPGTYDVCDIADTDVHGSLMGDHLTGNKVEIRAFSAETMAVCIGKNGCPDDLLDPQFDGKVLWMIGDDKLLRTVQPFEHDPAKPAQPHLVKVLKDSTEEPPETCKKSNVLILRICQPDPETKPTSWQCGSSSGPHGADAHIEN
jgi:hypothetical protein